MKLGQIFEFQIKAVDASPTENVNDVESEPSQEHEDVVYEYHVVNDASKTPGEDFPRRKDSHCPQPELELPLLLFPETIEQIARAEEKDDSPKHGEHAGHHQKVPDVHVSDVNEIEGDYVVSGVTAAWGRLMQTINVEGGCEHCPNT